MSKVVEDLRKKTDLKKDYKSVIPLHCIKTKQRI